MGALLGAAQPRAVDEESSFPLALCQKSTFPVDLCGHSVLFDISGSYRTAAGSSPPPGCSEQPLKFFPDMEAQRTTVFLPHQKRSSHASKSFSQASRQEKCSHLLRQKAISRLLVLISEISD